MINQDNVLSKKFKEHIINTTLKNAPVIIVFSFLFIGYYMYSDLFIRESLAAFYFRCIPFGIGIPLLIFHLLTKEKFKYLKFIFYHIFLVSGVIMMFGICLVHLNTDALAPSVTGTILIFFVFSLEVKTNTKIAVLLYFLPTSIFITGLLFYFKPTAEQFTVMADIFPIIVIGFIINRVQYKLRYKLFRSNHMLDLEKQKTEELYQETLTINEDLQQKTGEIIAHKEEIEEKNTILEENNATKDKFFAIISHDLIGPFNILMGFSDLLNSSFEEESIEEQKKYAHHIHKNVHKTYGLLENLLMWAKSQRDGMEFNLEKLNLFLVSNEMVEFLKESAENKSIQIENNISKDIMINADKNMLATVLRNLVSNAIKFTPKNGHIFLNAKLPQENSDQNEIEISVQDTGMGISPEVRPKLFSLSESISTKGTEKEEGTGLGLIICKEFIEKHGGTLRVESEPGRGSEFIFTLPE